jgi:hypothetical protein
MNVYDIIAEKKDLDEAPVGALKQMGRRVGAKAAGMVGMKQTAGNLKGKADTGAEANQLRKGFASFLGRIMKSPKEATAQDLAKYLSQSGYPVNALKGQSGVLSKQQIDKLTLQVVADKAAGAEVPGVGGADAPQDAPAKKQGALGAFAQGVKKGLGKDTAPAGGTANAAPVDKNKDGKDDNTGEPIQQQPNNAAQQGQAKGAAKLSPELEQKINSLSPEQKKELLGML